MSRFSVIRSALFITILLLAALRESIGTKQMKQTNFRKTLARAALSSFLIGSQITNVMPARAVETTFQQQLKVIQALQVEQQKINVQMATNKGVVGDSDADVIARGTVMIAANMYGVDASLYPLGFPEAAELDQAFANEEATMVITAVGRDGPPVAAKRMKLKGLQFPLSFELTSSDLIFPYTAAAWSNSPLSKDSIAVTCILDTDGQLMTPSSLDRFGFAISSPAVLGDLSQRTDAKVSINLKSDGHKYSADESDLLSRVDNFLAGAEKAKPVSPKAASI